MREKRDSIAYFIRVGVLVNGAEDFGAMEVVVHQREEGVLEKIDGGSAFVVGAARDGPGGGGGGEEGGGWADPWHQALYDLLGVLIMDEAR